MSYFRNNMYQLFNETVNYLYEKKNVVHNIYKRSICENIYNNFNGRGCTREMHNYKKLFLGMKKVKRISGLIVQICANYVLNIGIGKCMRMEYFNLMKV